MQIACDLLECLIKKKPMIAQGSISIPMPKKKRGSKEMNLRELGNGRRSCCQDSSLVSKEAAAS